MLVVSTRDFRANQTKYLNMVNAGESVVLKSRTGSYKITPITEDDAIKSKRDLASELRGALMEIKDALNEKRQLQTLDALINEL